MQLLHSSIAASSIVHLQHNPKYGPESANNNKRPFESRRERTYTMSYANDTMVSAGGFVARFRALRADLAERAAKNRLFNQTRNELSQLTDRDLADLGLARADIADVAYQAAYGK
jgi:uncharacterized protein YjiS (DUF1127 family)